MLSQTIIAFASVIATVSAWGMNGHMFAANIAQDILLENSPSTMEKALTTLQVLCDFDDYFCTIQDEHPFVESSVFADEYKYGPANWQGNMHFTDKPYFPDGESSDFNVKYDEFNITESTFALIQWLSEADDGEDYKNAYVYTYLIGMYDENVAESYALRLLIHYCGDVHQPLHAEDLYSEEYKSGDVGGNAFTIPSQMGDKNLHSVWDHMMFTQHVSIKRPIPADYWPTFVTDCSDILQRNIEVVSDPTTYENLSVAKWANESYDIATTVYDGLTKGEYIPDWYVDTFLPVAEQRVVLAGYRLAYVMQYIYPATAEVKETMFLQ